MYHLIQKVNMMIFICLFFVSYVHINILGFICLIIKIQDTRYKIQKCFIEQWYSSEQSYI